MFASAHYKTILYTAHKKIFYFFQVDVGAPRNKDGHDRMGRNKMKSATSKGSVSSTASSLAHETPLYSREDICEQYCISKKDADSSRRSKGFFGCLTSRKVSIDFQS